MQWSANRLTPETRSQARGEENDAGPLILARPTPNGGIANSTYNGLPCN
ncbi:MAG: hypothetical protein [Olavius algarvensis spirochete endosymbiont]|nr:MAG: hypothetical protein [Olavius algarvensis spirochete endosymbiont]